VIDLLVRRRWLAVALLLAAVAAVVPGAMKAVVPDNALTVWFLPTDPQLVAYHEFQHAFGNDEVILLMAEAPEGVFQPTVLRELAQVSEAIEEIDGVQRVHSLLTVQDAWESPEGLDFRPLVRRPIPDDEATLATAAARARANPLFQDRLVSADGKRAMLWIEMAVMADIDQRRDAIVGEVRTAVGAALGDRPHALGGIGVIYSGLNQITQHDFGLFVSVGYLIMFLLLGWIFRSGRIVLAALGVITVGTLFAIGVYGTLGHQLNMVTVVLPTLIIVLGVADAIHLPAAYAEARRAEPDRPYLAQVAATMRRVALPCVLTTATTVAGFLALASSPMAVIRELGLFAAVGVSAALVATFILMMVAFASLRGGYRPPSHRLLQAGLGRVEHWVIRRRLAVALGTALVIAAAAWGASRVVTDTYTIGYLPADDPVVLDHQAIERDWGPYSLLDFLVHPAEGRRMDDPEVLAALERFVHAAKEHPAIRDGFSLADMYRRMAVVYGGAALDDATGDEPLSPEQVAQLSLVLSMKRFEWTRGEPGYDDNFLAGVTTRDRRLGRLTLTGSMMSAKELDRLLEWLVARGAESMQGVATLEPAGYPPLYVKIIHHVMTSQIRGFFIALAVIFAMMLIGLRSLRLALLSLLPNCFPVLVMMGVMGAVGIHLDVATATVAAIVLGVSIDDTVHFLHHWKRAEARGSSYEACVRAVFRRAGTPAALTTLLLVVGFPVLMLAGVKTVVYFGLLTTVAAIAALYGDVLILPLLLRAFPGRRPAPSQGSADEALPSG
jgi:predicted RND superfamily exporter protein